MAAASAETAVESRELPRSPVGRSGALAD